MNNKICRVCKIEKEIIDFHKQKQGKNGINSACKKCRNKQSIEQYHIHKDERNIKNKIYRTVNKDRLKDAWLKRKFGITLSEYNKIFKEQNGCCAICNNPEIELDHRDNEIRDLAVDHNHITKEVRGLLCGKCNKGIGLLQDSIQLLNSAIVYLNKPKLKIVNSRD